MIKSIGYIFILIIPILLISGCNSTGENSENSTRVPVKVTVTNIVSGNISEMTQLNATSQYLKSHMINAPVSGYIVKANCITGTIAGIGDTLFVIKTREAKILDQSSQKLARDFDMKGNTDILSDTKGYIAQVFHQQGDFVAEGEPLASIKETGSLVFILELPFEWNDRIKQNMPLKLELTDQNVMKGRISYISPAVDPVSQTLKIYIRVPDAGKVPEGLTARVYLPLKTKNNTQVLPRAAVLANETETEFWIMKLINDSTAVKVPITPGVQNRDSIEVVSPEFSKADRILTSGNYAVPDTLLIKVIE